MKKLLPLLLLLTVACIAQTTSTPNIGLQIPAAGSTNWNLPLNFNFNLLDQLLGGLIDSDKVAYTLKPLFGAGAPSAACSTSNQGQNYFDTSGSSLVGYVCNNGTWSSIGGGSGGGAFPVGIVYGTSSTSARTAIPSDIASLLSTLSGCATANYVYSPANGNCLTNTISLQHNGTPNLDQTYLDLINGAGTNVNNTVAGHVSIDVNSSALNPPTYQTGSFSDTNASLTTSVTVTLTKGSTLLAFADSNTYGCLPASGQPYYPNITDSQGNTWTVKASNFSSYVGGNSGANMIIASAPVSTTGSDTITATQPNAGGTCAHEYLLVAEYANVVSVDTAGVQACSVGCSGPLAPSATAVNSNNETAIVMSETNSSSGATATPGTLVYSATLPNWPFIWQFDALKIGSATSSTVSNWSQNFGGAGIILLKGNLLYPSTVTITAGSNYAIPFYGPSSTDWLYPSSILLDSTGKYMEIPGSTSFAVTTVASAATIQPTTPIFHVTGTTDVDRMVPPGGTGGFCDTTGYGCTVTIIADSGFNFVHYAPNLTYSFITTGVATAGETLSFVYDHTTQFWYPITPLARGMATLTSGTVTISTAAACAVGSSCAYRLSNCGANASTAIGTPSLGTVTAGTSFVINSLSSTNTVVTGDVSNVCWQIN